MSNVGVGWIGLIGSESIGWIGAAGSKSGLDQDAINIDRNFAG